MRQQEFEQRTGKGLTTSEYVLTERIYMASGDTIDKDRFCKEWKDHKLSRSHVVAAMTERVERLEAKVKETSLTAAQLYSTQRELVAKLEEAAREREATQERISKLASENVSLALELLKAGLDHQAAAILGRPYVISLKCTAGIELTEADRAYVAEVLSRQRDTAAQIGHD